MTRVSRGEEVRRMRWCGTMAREGVMIVAKLGLALLAGGYLDCSGLGVYVLGAYVCYRHDSRLTGIWTMKSRVKIRKLGDGMLEFQELERQNPSGCLCPCPDDGLS